MDRREAERVSEFGLGDRQGEAVAVREPDGVQTGVQLADEVGDPLLGLAPSVVEEPLAQDGLVDERHPPEGPLDRRSCPELQDAVTWDVHDHRGRHGRDGVVHLVQDEHVHVAEVARDEERDDLPVAVLQELVAAGEAFDHEPDVGRGLALHDDVLVGRHLAGSPDDVVEQALVVVRKRTERLQLAREQVDHGSPCRLPDVLGRPEQLPSGMYDIAHTVSSKRELGKAGKIATSLHSSPAMISGCGG